MSRPGGGNKKIGRWKRKPSNQRYKSEQRWIKNKARKAAKRERQLEKMKLSRAGLSS